MQLIGYLIQSLGGALYILHVLSRVLVILNVSIYIITILSPETSNHGALLSTQMHMVRTS